MTDSVKGALLTMFGGMCWGVSGCVGQYLRTLPDESRAIRM